MKGTKCDFFHGSTCVAHKDSGFFAHGCLRKMIFFTMHVSMKFSDFLHVSHMNYPFLHVFVLHVYFETPPLEKTVASCPPLVEVHGTHRQTPSAMTSLNRHTTIADSERFLHGHMNTGSRAHHTRPQVESKDADPNPPIKIHGPLASTLFLRAIHAQTKNNLHI